MQQLHNRHEFPINDLADLGISSMERNEIILIVRLRRSAEPRTELDILRAILTKSSSLKVRVLRAKRRD